MDLNINTIDLTIIVVYLVGILLVGILSVRLRKMTSEGYFLAGRGLGWVMVGAALFASNISTIHLVGLQLQVIMKDWSGVILSGWHPSRSSCSGWYLPPSISKAGYPPCLSF